MRKLKLQVQMSVDGFMAGVKDEMDWITWNLDDALLKHISDINKDIDCILMGRVLADGFIQHWKTEATDPIKKREFVKRMSEPYDFAMKMYQTPKVVFSKSLQGIDPASKGWENTTIASKNIAEEVNALKNKSGKDIIAYGGSTLVSDLIKNKLIDEFNLFVNPAAIGKGKPIFHTLEGKLNLKLVDCKSYNCGIVVMQYVPADKIDRG